MKCQLAFTVPIRLHKFVQFNAVGGDNGVALFAHFQVGVASEFKTVVGIVRPLTRGNIHYSFCSFSSTLVMSSAKVKNPSP